MSLTGKSDLTTIITLSNDGFWPDMAMADLLGKYRVPPEYDDNVIQWGLQLSMVRVNDYLQRAKDEIFVLGFNSYQLYNNANPNIINNEDVMAVYYEHAVMSRAKAFLLKQFNSLNRRKDAENAAMESDETEQYWLDESQHAISSILRVFFPTEQFAGNANVHVAAL